MFRNTHKNCALLDKVVVVCIGHVSTARACFVTTRVQRRNSCVMALHLDKREFLLTATSILTFIPTEVAPQCLPLGIKD